MTIIAPKEARRPISSNRYRIRNASRHVACSFRRSERKSVSSSQPEQKQTPEQLVNAIQAAPPSSIVAVLNFSQGVFLLSVLAIQVRLVVSRQATRTASISKAQAVSPPLDPVYNAAEFQPLLLVGAMGCSLIARLFTPTQKFEVQTGSFTSQIVQHDSELAQIKQSLKVMDRQLSKVQSRVFICAEQFRAARRESEAIRTATSEVLCSHGSALAEVQEQANSLQTLMGSLQEVMVKQIAVITPPIKSLSTRVRVLEESMQNIHSAATELKEPLQHDRQTHAQTPVPKLPPMPKPTLPPETRVPATVSSESGAQEAASVLRSHDVPSSSLFLEGTDDSPDGCAGRIMSATWRSSCGHNGTGTGDPAALGMQTTHERCSGTPPGASSALTHSALNVELSAVGEQGDGWGEAAAMLHRSQTSEPALVRDEGQVKCDRSGDSHGRVMHAMQGDDSKEHTSEHARKTCLERSSVLLLSSDEATMRDGHALATAVERRSARHSGTDLEEGSSKTQQVQHSRNYAASRLPGCESKLQPVQLHKTSGPGAHSEIVGRKGEELLVQEYTNWCRALSELHISPSSVGPLMHKSGLLSVVLTAASWCLLTAV